MRSPLLLFLGIPIPINIFGLRYSCIHGQAFETKTLSAH